MNYNPAAWTFEHDRALTMLKEKSEHELKNFFADIKDMNAFHTWKGGHYNLLFHAVTENNFPAVKALVEFGVSPTLENNKGINVLHLIVKRGQLEMAEVCLRHLKHEAEKISFLNNANGIGWSVLIQSCSLVQGRENVKLVEWLLEAGANVNHAMGSGWTALHAAAYNGHIETVKVLLKRGADTLATASKKDRPPGRNLKPVDVTDVVMIKELLNNAASLT